MQRLLAILLVMLLAFTVACGDDDDAGGDDGGDDPTPTLTTGTGTGGGATATTAGGGGDSTPTTADGGEGDAAAGEELATSNGCLGCHSTDGSTLVGPTWQGLYGSEVELEGGDTVTADDAYIAESIREPGAQVVAGFSNVMPPFDLDDQQIADIIAYIQSLE